MSNNTLYDVPTYASGIWVTNIFCMDHNVKKNSHHPLKMDHFP